MSQAIARRYARAVFELGRDTNTLESLVTDMTRLAEAYASSAELREIDRLPNISDAARRAVLSELGKAFGASEAAINTVALLADRQRLSLLPDVAALLSEMGDEHAGVVRATVRSAKKLAPAYVTRLADRIAQVTGKKVVITTEEDPSLIAGVVAQIGDRVIDGTVRGRLDRLAESLRHT
ncbi:MAG: F0F1 ATP synthase subunit delta [Deltaproteobacteria bacterium]|nr:F0F1 ATP synthase subunit delta [Deltaproteobacteria bacterium]